MISAIEYPYKPWDTLPNIHHRDEFTIADCAACLQPCWKEYMNHKFETNFFKDINSALVNEIEMGYDVYPYPDLMFHVFNTVNLDDIRVVFIGQDPYVGAEFLSDTKVPQAMGLSFSVPVGIKIPPSLGNIFRNQQKYGIISQKPAHGNLQYWELQGCFMLNAALTVRENNSNSHAALWQPFTDKIIKRISTELNDVVFVLWGAFAHDKIKFIDQKKHKVIVSSHPSSYSYDSPMRGFPSFSRVDHFGQINKHLVKMGHNPIAWALFRHLKNKCPH